MREAQAVATNEIRSRCGSEPEFPPGLGSRPGRMRAFALPGLAAVADRLRRVPRRGSASGADPARLLDNGSTPGSCRRPEPLPPSAGETPQPDRKRARRPARARRVGGALLPALAAIVAVSLSVQGHAQTSVPHDWGLKPAGLGTGDEFRLLFVSSTSRNGTSSDIGDYDTHVQTAAASGHADVRGYSALFKAVGCTSTTAARDHTGTTYTAADKGVVIRWLGGAQVADEYEDFYDGSWDSSSPKSQTGASVSTSLSSGVITGCRDNGTKSGSELGDTGNVTQSNPSANTGLAGNTTSPGNSRKVYGLSPVFVVAAPPPDPTVVPENWSLKPSGLSVGDQFRLIFLSSTKRDGSATDIATYNTFVQTRAAAGHTDIQAYSDGFNAVGCTADVDARDNTYTIGTGVPIHWLNGNKAADDYADFYDGDWDEEANDKNELGANGPNTNNSGNYPLTGCDHDGTEYFSATNRSLALGTDDVNGGRPNSSTSGHGPLSGAILDPTINRPMYGLSAVFEVGAAVVTNSAPTFGASTAARNVAENTAAGQNVGAVLTATDSDGDTLTYTLEGTDAASFDLVTTADPAAQIRTKTGVTYDHEAKSTYTVVVKADDGNGGTDTVTVTISVTDVDEAPGRPAAPSVSATSGSTTSLDASWTAPANTGPDIDHYDLRYREGTSGNFTDGPQNQTGTGAAIGSLDAGTAYQVQVRATNAEGDGDWSESGSGTTATPINSAPVFADSTADRSVDENTAAGQNVGAVLTATDADSDPLTYTLEGADAASFDIVTTADPAAQIRTGTGVTYNHEVTPTYTVVVKADDGNGGTDTVTVTITVTDVDEAPGRPLAPTVAAVTGLPDRLIVEWLAPTNTGPEIDTYDLRYQKTTESIWTDGPQDELPYATGGNVGITGLDAGTAYRVQVRATNAEGDGEWSPSGTGTTSAAATPTVSISADKTSAVFKQDDITFTLTRTGPTTDALDVSVTLTQDVSKDFLLTADLTQTVTIAADQSTNTFTIAASSFQNFAVGTTVEGGILTATVQDGADYDLGTTPAVGVTIVIGVTVRIDQASYSVSEAAGTLTVKAIGRTRTGEPRPTSDTSEMDFALTDGTAINPTDYSTIDSSAFEFAPSSYSLQGDGAWQAVKTFGISVPDDDLDEEDETFTVTLGYQFADLDATPLVDVNGNSCGTKCEVTVTITDDDTAGVTVSKTALTVEEEDTTGDTYTVVLDSRPTADVTITIGGHSGTDVTAAPSPLTFTPMNWATARTVTVTAADDIDTATDTVTLTHTATSTDPDYDAVAASVTVTVNDNDTTNTAPTFPSSTAARSVDENTAAGQNVGAVLTATDSDSDTLTYTLEGTDAASFDLVTTTDPAAQLRTKTGVTYNHEAKSTYTVVVKADDGNGGTDTVTVTITVTDVDEAPGRPAAPNVSATSGSTTSLDASWTEPTNTGPDIDDYDLRYREGTSGDFTDGPQNQTGTGAAIGSLDAGTAYQVQVRATNDEGDGDWSESGSGSTTTPANNAPVFADSTADRSVDENTAAGQNVGAVLTATDADSDPLTYTLEGADASSFDIVAVTGSGQIRTKPGTTYDHEAKSSYSVTVRASDGTDSDTIAVAITVEDVNEAPGRPAAPNVSATSGSTTSLDVGWTAPTNTGPDIDDYDLRYRAGTSGSFTDGPRNVTGTSAAIGSLDAGTAYQVRVRATNPEGDGQWSLSGSGTTGTAATPGVTVSESSLTVTEEDATGVAYTVVLDSQPTANVVVTVAGHSGTDVLPAPTTLTFTTVDWGTARTVTVTAGGDADTADDTATLTHGAASADGDYGGIAIDDVAVTVRDNDTAKVTGVTVAPGNAQLAVGWTAVGNATGYRVQWKSGGQPYNASRQATVGSGSTRSHTISGLANGTEYTLRVRADRTGADSGPWSDDATGTPEAPTTPGVTVSRSALTVTEQDATGDSYTLVLDTRPTANVAVTVAGHAGTDVTPSPTALTFTTGDWGTPRTVTVTAGDDADTADDSVTLTHGATSADAGYDGIAIAGVAVTVRDDDTANNAPVFDDGAATTRSFAETIGAATVGASVEFGTPVTATDGDGDTPTYGIGGTDAARFGVDASTGRLRRNTGESYDHETRASYDVTVTADDGNGGTASIEVTIVVDDEAEAPPAPAAPTVTAVGTTGLAVAWSAPDNAGRPAIADYDLRRRAPGGAWTDGPQDIAGTAASIADLAPGTEYEVQVRATNADGDGPWSAAGSGTTGGAATHRVHLFAAASDPRRQGFVRVVNHATTTDAAVTIEAVDDAGVRTGPATLGVGAAAAAHFNSDDLGHGNPAKNLSGGIGDGGTGDRRLELTAEADVEVLSYMRTPDGFVTSLHDAVPVEAGVHRVAFFNPASNVDQASRLRIVNLGTRPRPRPSPASTTRAPPRARWRWRSRPRARWT